MQTGSVRCPRGIEAAAATSYKSAGLSLRHIRLNSAIAALFILTLLLTACEKKEEAAKPGPPEVGVVAPLQQDVPVFEEWVAQLNGPVNAEITPKVQGYLLKQNYQNGYFVKAGQLLFELDPRQYQAAVDQSKADVAVAEANLVRVQADVARDTPLAAQSAIPQKQLDNDVAEQASWEAQLKAKKAALQNAELNLGWTKVFSPIDGIAGVSNAQVGDLVGTATKMTTVSQVNPIWAYFNISESKFLDIAPDINQIITGKVNISSLHSKPIEYIQANNLPYPAKGQFIYVNRQVGTQTGTIQVAAQFANPDALLRPGGFGRIRIETGEDKGALLVPQAAVTQVQSMFLIAVVTPDNKAVFRPVKMGDRVGTNWIIAEGLKPGERVVVDGLLKIQMAAAQDPELAKTGIPVVAKPYVPSAAPAGGN